MAESSRANQLPELLQVDVAARYDRDNRTGPSFPGQCGSEAQGASPFGDDSSLLRHETHGAFGLLQRDDDRAIDHRFHALPHAREKTLATGAIDERRPPPGEHLRRPL